LLYQLWVPATNSWLTSKPYFSFAAAIKTDSSLTELLPNFSKDVLQVSFVNNLFRWILEFPFQDWVYCMQPFLLDLKVDRVKTLIFTVGTSYEVS
jgi:hypothetical protein